MRLDDPEVLAYIQRTVAAAPPLSSGQRDKIAILLCGAPLESPEDRSRRQVAERERQERRNAERLAAETAELASLNVDDIEAIAARPETPRAATRQHLQERRRERKVEDADRILERAAKILGTSVPYDLSPEDRMKAAERLKKLL